MRKTYTAGLVGESVAHFISSGDESGRGYLAAERVTGTLDDGRSGSFTVHHGALQHPDDDSAFGYIVPGTGTGDFAPFAGIARASCTTRQGRSSSSRSTDPVRPTPGRVARLTVAGCSAGSSSPA